MSMYFLRKISFHFPSRGEDHNYREKEISSFLIIQERSYSSVIFLGRRSFQNSYKKKIWFFVQCYFLIFGQVFHTLLDYFLWVDQKILCCQLMHGNLQFLLMACNTLKKISCRIIPTSFERLNKQSINNPKCWINHIIQIIIIWLCCYF